MMKKYSVFILACCVKLVIHRTTKPCHLPHTNQLTLFVRCARPSAALIVCLLIIGATETALSQTGYTQSENSIVNRYATQQPTYQYPATHPPRTNGSSSVYGTQPQPGFQSSNPYQVHPPSPDPAVIMQPQTGAVTGPTNFQTPGFQAPQTVPYAVTQPGVLDIDVTVPQALTQRISIGGTYGSDNGLMGQFVFDERDFDIRGWPRSLDQAFSRSAWSGGGQHFRVEAVPGDELARYLVSWSNPYFRNSDFSLSLSGFLYDRQYLDYDEQRAGGRIGVGRQLSDYLSINYGLRMETVTIDNPRVGTSPQLNAVLGDSNLFLGSVGLVYDTRLYPYLTGVGSYLGLTFTQAFGDYHYSRGEIDFRNHRTIYQRMDGSGRHTIEFRTKLGFSGNSTPVFENFVAGGMTSLRGFDYRGVSPIEGGVRVGGQFQWLSSLEYNFPLTQGDMVHGVMFVDFGTVEESVELNSANFRIAPGLGLRVHLPYAGLGAPLAFDFAFPVSTATGDLEQSFGFLIGIIR